MQAESLRNGLLGALLSILLFALAGFYSVTAALFYAVIGVLAGVLVGALLSGRQAEIQPAERIDWSWGGIRRSLMKIDHVRNGLLCGLAYWLTDGLSGGYGSWGFSMLKGMVLGVLLSWLTYGITKGLSSRMLDKVALIKPNQGIWRSAQNS